MTSASTPTPVNVSGSLGDPAGIGPQIRVGVRGAAAPDLHGRSTRDFGPTSNSSSAYRCWLVGQLGPPLHDSVAGQGERLCPEGSLTGRSRLPLGRWYSPDSAARTGETPPVVGPSLHEVLGGMIGVPPTGARSSSPLRWDTGNRPFFRYPAAHWVHLRTTNPIESAMATVRLRMKVTKCPGWRATGMAMAYKLIGAAQAR